MFDLQKKGLVKCTVHYTQALVIKNKISEIEEVVIFCQNINQKNYVIYIKQHLLLIFSLE